MVLLRVVAVDVVVPGWLGVGWTPAAAAAIATRVAGVVVGVIIIVATLVGVVFG